jgi:dinuclear metal center YbgI/SA1388 family protein
VKVFSLRLLAALAHHGTSPGGRNTNRLFLRRQIWFATGVADVPLITLARYCDRLLRLEQFTDWEGAVNGLQVENRGRVTRLAAAVDASLATIQLAVAAGADLLLVHHGLFWAPTHPWTGVRYDVLRRLLDHNLAVYSAHLPLDAHPKLGNNAQLCGALSFRKLRPFFEEKGQFIGWQTRTRLRREELARRLAQVTGRPPIVLAAGPPVCRRVGVISGGAGAELKRASAARVDTLITGEGPHWTSVLAQELRINVFYAGHYATETFGVKALAEHLARKFGLPWTFLDCPSGL